MAIEIVNFPKMVLFHRFLYVYQRVPGLPGPVIKHGNGKSPHRNGEGVSIGMCDFLEGRLTLLSTLRLPNSGTAPTSGFIQFGKCQFHRAKKPDVESVDPFRNNQRKSVVNTGSSRKWFFNACKIKLTKIRIISEESLYKNHLNHKSQITTKSCCMHVFHQTKAHKIS